MDTDEDFWEKLARSRDSMTGSEVKKAVFKYYRERLSTFPNSPDELDSEQQNKYSGWLVSSVENEASSIYYRRESVIVPGLSPTLSFKISTLSQYHCPICRGTNGPVVISPIRVTPESYQYLKRKRGDYLGAFTRAVRASLDVFGCQKFDGDLRLCVHIVFVLSKTAIDKDVDNMIKITLDALKGKRFGDDKMVDHLSTIKIRTQAEEGWIVVNVRPTFINEHKDVFLKVVNHIFSEQQPKRIEDYL